MVEWNVKNAAKNFYPGKFCWNTSIGFISWTEKIGNDFLARYVERLTVRKVRYEFTKKLYIWASKKLYQHSFAPFVVKNRKEDTH